MKSFPDYKTIIDRVRLDVSSLIPDLNPANLFGSFIRAITDSCGGRHYDNVLLLQQLENEQFPETCSGDALERWAGYEGIVRHGGNVATGKITITGTVGKSIGVGVGYRSESNNVYTVTDGGTIAQVVSSITITRVGNLATAVTSTDHELSSEVTLFIDGAVETEYNGSHVITVTDDDKFTFEVLGAPATPATGTITATGDYVGVTLESQDTGTGVNVIAGLKMSLIITQAGINTDAYTQFGAIAGGTGAESNPALYLRVLSSRSNPVANFSVGAITKACLDVSGVTRVLVKRITPAVGDVTVLFVRDGDEGSIIPDASELLTVKTRLIEDLPAQSAEADLYVLAPTPVTTNYTFSAIYPNTPSMQDAINANLEAFYRDKVTFDTDVSEDAYSSAIIGTIDPTNGDILNSFTLTSPSGDVSVSSNEIGVIGTVTMP